MTTRNAGLGILAIISMVALTGRALAQEKAEPAKPDSALAVKPAPIMPELKDDGSFTFPKYLTGKISGPPAAPTHGIEFLTGAVPPWQEGVPVTRPMCMNVESYLCTKPMNGCHYGRKAPQTFERFNENTMRVRMGPFQGWKVDCEILFTLLPDGVVQVRYTFTFGEDYPIFEAFVSNYFPGCYPSYMHLDGKWCRAEISKGGDPSEHRYWCPSQEMKKRLEAIWPEHLRQFREFHDKPSPEVMDDRLCTAPIIVSPVHTPGYAVVHWVEPETCMNLSANERWGASDFCLVGRDVKKGETVVCHAWMAYRKIGMVRNANNVAVPDNQSLDKTLEWAKTLNPVVVSAPAGRATN